MIKSQFMQTGFRRAGALALVVALFGCTSSGQPLEPKILTFNYMVIQYSNEAAIIALIASIRSGQTTVADELPTDSCNFTASFADTNAGTNQTSINFSGNPGQTGFNIRINDMAPVNITTTNPTDCQPVSEIEIFIGHTNEALDIGGQTNKTFAEMVVGGNIFETYGGFFVGSLTTFRQQTGYASGEFQFVSTAPGAAANARLLVSGFYASD